ncbi:Prolyl 4-hydroxylase subunit alpha-2, partial [Orchesella cincta]
YLKDFESDAVLLNSSTSNVPMVREEKSNGLSRKDALPAIDIDAFALSVTAHPLKAYKLLRRYVKDLPALEKELRLDEERKFLKLTEKVKTKVPFPTQRDMQGATEGILRAHDTYNMNIDDVRIDDKLLFDLATILTRAIQWLERAYKLVVRESDDSISRKQVKDKLDEVVSQHNEALARRSKNPYLFTEPVKLHLSLEDNTQPRKRLLDTEHHVLLNKHSSMTDLTNFAALCGGKQLRSNVETSRLNCWFEKKQPLNIISPLKVEMLNRQPSVLQFYDLLSEKTSGKIVESARSTLGRSQVYAKSHPDSKMISQSRTSTSTWLKDDRSSKLKEIMMVYRKIEAYTGLNIIENGASEDLQVSCYGIAGHFNPHLDTIFNSVERKHLNKEELHRGDRYATLMFYLTDVPRGGSTAFSRTGVVANPVKGSAIFWYNMNENGEPDPLALHGGCPILYGNKCVSNKWIRFNSQSRHQCNFSQNRIPSPT